MLAVETTEAAFESAVIELAKTLRWRTAHFSDSRRQIKPGVFVGDTKAKGFPDVVLCRPPRLVIVELKREKGKLKAEQKVWLELLCQVPGVEVFLWRPRDWPEIEAVLR